MWKKWPDARIGIVMGWPGKLLALMTDGQGSARTLQSMAVGELRSTITMRDHDRQLRLFRADGKLPHSRDIADGIRILGDGELIIAPSNRTRSTSERRFAKGRAPGEIDIARAPDWLREIGPADFAPVRNAGAASANAPQLTAEPSMPSHTPRREPSIVVVRTSEIEPERIVWVWPGIVTSGRVTGPVKVVRALGKSQVAIRCGGDRVDRAPLAGRRHAWERRRCAYSVGGGDDVADTIVPRLIAAGGRS